MARMVECAKLGRLLPALDEPPFPGLLGQRIYNEISRDAWEQWRQHQTILINHYALNPVDPDARKMLREEMEKFFFADESRKPEGWVPAGAAAGGGSKGGGAEPGGLDSSDPYASSSSKGGGAAQRKK
jgi:Fe-S cluster biosynthesis and repair protein YggX